MNVRGFASKEEEEDGEDILRELKFKVSSEKYISNAFGYPMRRRMSSGQSDQIHLIGFIAQVEEIEKNLPQLEREKKEIYQKLQSMIVPALEDEQASEQDSSTTRRQSASSFDAPTLSSTTGVQKLGVVGRGTKRIQLQPRKRPKEEESTPDKQDEEHSKRLRT